MDYSLKEAAVLLGIAPPTLRKWSEQFDVLLSDSARRAATVDGSTTPRRYTESDVAILQRARTLLQSGRTHEQVLRELANDQQAEAFDRPVDSSHPASARHDYTTRQLSAAPTPGEQDAQKEDERTATMEHALQAQQSQIDQLREYLERLQAENEALRERRMPLRERFPWLFSYRTAAILAICAIAVLAAFGIVWLDNPRGLVGTNSTSIASTASPFAAAANSTNRALLPTTSRQALTPTSASAQVAATAPVQAVSSPASSPQALPPTAPIPTAAPTVAAVAPATSAPSVSDTLQRVVAAEAALRTGQFVATIDYGGGTRSSSQVRFDLGGAEQAPRFHITSSYTGTTGIQTVERITIGDQSWQREQNGHWSARPAQEGVVDQIRVFLPHTDTITSAEATRQAGATVLRWHELGRDVDVTLVVDTATGVPRELRQVTRTTGTVLTVSYQGWNSPVEIAPPDTT